MGYAKRVDANLSELVQEFRNLGCSVHVTNGAWDATVGYGGLTLLVEVKNDSQPPSKQKYTPAQEKFREKWTGGIYLVRNIADVYSAVATLKNWHRAIRQPFAPDDQN